MEKIVINRRNNNLLGDMQFLEKYQADGTLGNSKSSLSMKYFKIR